MNDKLLYVRNVADKNRANAKNVTVTLFWRHPVARLISLVVYQHVNLYSSDTYINFQIKWRTNVWPRNQVKQLKRNRYGQNEVQKMKVRRKEIGPKKNLRRVK